MLSSLYLVSGDSPVTGFSVVDVVGSADGLGVPGNAAGPGRERHNALCSELQGLGSADAMSLQEKSLAPAGRDTMLFVRELQGLEEDGKLKQEEALVLFAGDLFGCSSLDKTEVSGEGAPLFV